MKKMDLFENAEIISSDQLITITGGDGTEPWSYDYDNSASNRHDNGDSTSRDHGDSYHSDWGDSQMLDHSME